MKHGRPSRDNYWFAGKPYKLVRSSDGLGWRREHAHRVWQAIQAVLSVVVVAVVHQEHADAMAERLDARRKDWEPVKRSVNRLLHVYGVAPRWVDVAKEGP